MIGLRRDLLSFARQQWPVPKAAKRGGRNDNDEGGGADAAAAQDEDSDAEFVGGDFWDAVVAACAETEPLPDAAKFADVEDPALVEFSESERPLAELLLQLGVVERVVSATGALSASRLKLVDEVFGEE